MARGGVGAGIGDGRRPRLRREDWARAALASLADGGLAAVVVETLADRLGTTKGSFSGTSPTARP